VGEGGTYAVYYTTSSRMASDVQEIARSLGAIATISTRMPKTPANAQLQYYINPDKGFSRD
jgi:hypothetical protein